MSSPDRIAQVYTAHGHVVLRRARQILKDETEAQDVLHEVFASLLRKPEQFEGRSSVTTFLYSATTHLCLNRLRDGTTRARLLAQQGPANPEEARGDRLLQVRQLLARLPEDLAQVTVYYYVDEMTHEEIADQLGCSRRQVGNLLERAVELCRQQERGSVSHA
jgi:RNA polymerase sigma-70 factor (ECF subfamily)